MRGLGGLQRAFGAQIGTQVLVALLALAAALALRRARPGPFGLHWPTACLACGSAVAVGVATLTRQGVAGARGELRLQPLHTLREYHNGYQTAESVIIYGLGNVALFVPLGFFVYLALRHSVVMATLVGAAASLTVEILQLPIWSRSTDVDDVLTNSLGAFLGAALAAVLARMPQAWKPPLLFHTGSQEWARR